MFGLLFFITSCATQQGIKWHQVKNGDHKLHITDDITAHTVKWVVEQLLTGNFVVVDKDGNLYAPDSEAALARLEDFENTNWQQPWSMGNCAHKDSDRFCTYPNRIDEKRGYKIQFCPHNLRDGGTFHWGIIWIINGKLHVYKWTKGFISG